MATIADPPPYTGLTPDCVLDALDSVGIRGDGRLLALNSYENRVYQAWRDDDPPVVVKFYRPARWTDAQIVEEHAFVGALAAAEVPAIAPMSDAGPPQGANTAPSGGSAAAKPQAWGDHTSSDAGPPQGANTAPSGGSAAAKPQAWGDHKSLDGSTLHAWSGFRFAVFPRHGGRAPELERRDTLVQLGRYIARIHSVGATQPFEHRPALTIEAFGDDSRAYLLEHDFVPPDLRAPWQSIVDLALAAVRRAFERVVARPLRLHGDCHGGNVLWTDSGPHFVDFDDARMGPAVQDLWMLLSGERAAMEMQLAALLEGYEWFRDFDRRELVLVEPLRTLRLLHYSAWIARRWDDPAFPAAFPWFNTQRYWQDRILELREQVALMDEPPLRA